AGATPSLRRAAATRRSCRRRLLPRVPRSSAHSARRASASPPSLMRVLALDHGEARCGVAVSDPTGELVTPLAAVERPDTRRGLAALAALVRERDAERVVVGLPLTMRGEEGEQAAAARAFADRLADLLEVPVDLYDERLT